MHCRKVSKVADVLPFVHSETKGRNINLHSSKRSDEKLRKNSKERMTLKFIYQKLIRVSRLQTEANPDAA